MARITFLALTDDMIKQAKKIIKNTDTDVETKIVSPENALTEARNSVQEGTNVIIARGSIATSISEKINTPVVEIVLTGQEIGQLVYKAKEILQKKYPVIAIVGTSNMFGPTKVFDEMLNVTIKEYFVKYREELEIAVEKAVKDNVDFIIGGELVNAYANKHKIPTLFLKSTEDSIREAFRIAEKVVYTSELEKKNTAEFKTILDYSFDGIIKLNDKGIIVLVNYLTERILKKGSEEIIGKHITEVIDAISKDLIEKVLKDGKEIYSTLLQNESLALAANLAPIMIDKKIDGVIISLQEFKKIEKLESQIRKELYAKGYIAKSNFEHIIGNSSKIDELKTLAKLYAKYDSPILIMGEIGTGKKMFAQCIHNESLRKINPFVAVDCTSMLSEQLENKLYGYLENNYVHSSTIIKKGMFDIAHTGTIVLNEISELDKYGQSNLLRALKEDCIVRRGDDKVLPIDVRIICTSTKNLAELVREGKFNAELYYMLNVLRLNITPLRERKEDIITLLDNFIREYNIIYKKYAIFTEGAKAVINSYPWYGNVTQLKKFYERLIILSQQKVINEDFVNANLEFYTNNLYKNDGRVANEEKRVVVYGNYEAAKILELLEKYNGKRQKVAEELNISTTTLWRKIKKYNIENTFNF
ncbi:sigma 54-interacting transcriptional regulator [Clostridium sp. BL-8]|uniref:sigma 54-interacting transcriptional regulator n=1 Tax=Clostridium sp. BL-8 TaxID=349938 RepID=UPI00098CE338|nr:sigma 54-interacting transcriptional regulator [Clostridium sp. BL-8]OOM80844.1 propionate catabolism operon regulatory protein [Clostridium sp. BL-8]